MKKNRLRIAVFLVLALIGAEIILRLTGIDNVDTRTFTVIDGSRIGRVKRAHTFTDPDSNMSHLVTWNDRMVRQPPAKFDLDSEPETRTILLIGDDVVEGVSCPDEGTLSVAMQRILQAADPKNKWQVVNGGLKGSGPVEQFFFMRQLASEVKPETVIQFHAPNDLDGLANSPHSTFEDGKLIFHEPITIVGSFWKSLALVKAFQSDSEAPSATTIADALARNSIGPRETATISHYEALLALQSEFLAVQGIELVLCEVPMPADWLNIERTSGFYASGIGEICDSVQLGFKRLKMPFDAGLSWPKTPEEFTAKRGNLFFKKADRWNTIANLTVALELTSTMLRRDVREIPAVQKLLNRVATAP